MNGSLDNKLDAYVGELYHWNRRLRLVGVRDPDRFRRGHLAEIVTSLPDIRPLPWSRAVDIGSGNGLIGIPLACAFPNREVIALEPQAKKGTFLRHIRQLLQLDNLTVTAARLEDYRPEVLPPGKLLWAARSIEIPLPVVGGILRGYAGSYLWLFSGEKAKSQALIESDDQWLNILHRRRLDENTGRFSVLAAIR